MAGGRGQTKRIQMRCYNYLVDEGTSKSTHALVDWYNTAWVGSNGYYVRGANYGTSNRKLSAILTKSMLFECDGWTKGKYMDGSTKDIRMWKARPIEKVIDKAIASRKPIKKFPHFLQLAIKERMENE